MSNFSGEVLFKYFKEVLYMKGYIAYVIVVLILSYSVYFVFSEQVIARIGSEDHIFEWLTALCFIGVSVLLLLVYRKTRILYFLVFSIIFFAGFGEEISWGQRVFNFETPEYLRDANVQDEFNFHNIHILNTKNHDGSSKEGIARLLEINFLFKLFTICFGIILPFAVFHFGPVVKLTKKIKLPIPPISIGIFFLVNWLVFRILLSYILPEGNIFQYYDTITEIFEFISSFILLMIAFFYLNNTGITPGIDIKQTPEYTRVLVVSK